MIDLSRMKGVRVDSAVCAIRAESGCAQADLTHAAHSFDLAVPVGIISTTGISGLTLGGGTGYLTRKYGLALDNLLEAAVVLADGRFLTASAKEILICFGRSAALGETLASSPRFTFAGVRWIRCLPVRCSGRWNTHASVLEWYREITQVPNREQNIRLRAVKPGKKRTHTLYSTGVKSDDRSVRSLSLSALAIPRLR